MTESVWTYLDVAPVAIQSYLARTPDLKGRRGASAWLSHTSHRDALPAWVAAVTAGVCDAVEVNEQAGQADGLVALRLPADADAHRVAEAVMVELRARLPAVRLTARWATGPSYVDVYRESFSTGLAARAGDLPAPGDFPPLESCVQCRADPAVGAIDLHEKTDLKVCADCLARYTDPYRRPGLWHGKVPLSAESDLLAALGISPGRVVDDFGDLAALGAADGNRNHLATVYIDGNALGELFDRISMAGPPDLKATVSVEVSEATRAALAAATAAVLDPAGTDGDTGPERVPVIPHVVGGDDVLVSVVADRAWRFTTVYLVEFAARMAQVAGLSEYQPGGRPVSASAGLIFAHAKFPFRRCVEFADQALHTAKHAYAGRSAAVAWLDVTRDGEQPPPARCAWPLDALTDLDRTLRALSGVDAAGRAALQRLADPATPTVSMARLREHARRLERADVLEPLLAYGGPAAVADALSIVRWWQ